MCKTILVLLMVCAVRTVLASDVKPLVQAHAHNDYLHERPLFDALQRGFCSVEVDIHIVNGQLLVAHDLKKTTPERSLQALYLDPLREEVRKNDGWVFQKELPFTLLIDLKTNWQSIYPVLRTTLTNYADMLTAFRDMTIQTNAVQVIITGDRNPRMFSGERIRYAALDGTVEHLDRNPSDSLIPWISIKWKDHFSWDGVGTMATGELEHLKNLTHKTHAQKRRIRFWGAPDNPVFWQTMLAAEVDLINTDDLAGLETLIKSGPVK